MGSSDTGYIGDEGEDDGCVWSGRNSTLVGWTAGRFVLVPGFRASVFATASLSCSVPSRTTIGGSALGSSPTAVSV
jgi:hypothetical protein